MNQIKNVDLATSCNYTFFNKNIIFHLILILFQVTEMFPLNVNYNSPDPEDCSLLLIPNEMTLSLLSSRYTYEECKATADWLLAQAPVRPLLGVVCGSGLGGLAEMLKDPLVIEYSDIPNFPQSTGEFSVSNARWC